VSAGPETLKFFEAIASRDTKRVRAFLKKDPGLARARDPNGNSPVLVAAYVGAPEIAEILANAGAQVTIFEAAALGRDDLVRDLLAINPALLHALAHDGWSLLHLAAFFGHADLARFLIAEGADLQSVSRNPMANTPLHSAVAGRRPALARILLEAGADPDALAHGLTPLHLAAHAGHQPMAELLLAFGAQADLADPQGKTPADLAHDQGFPAMGDLIRKF
jgi:ankyrin repeat protein